MANLPSWFYGIGGYGSGVNTDLSGWGLAASDYPPGDITPWLNPPDQPPPQGPIIPPFDLPPGIGGLGGGGGRTLPPLPQPIPPPPDTSGVGGLGGGPGRQLPPLVGQGPTAGGFNLGGALRGIGKGLQSGGSGGGGGRGSQGSNTQGVQGRIGTPPPVPQMTNPLPFEAAILPQFPRPAPTFMGSFQEGGIVPQTGLYPVRGGEQVIPRNQVSPFTQQRPFMPRGMIAPGNINLTGRPIVRNADGSISTEFSTSFGDRQGREVLVPTVVNGKFLTPSGAKPPEGFRDDKGKYHPTREEKAMWKRAQQHYENTGEHMGMFDSPKSADTYAEQVHNRSMGGTNVPSYVYRGSPGAGGVAQLHQGELVLPRSTQQQHYLGSYQGGGTIGQQPMSEQPPVPISGVSQPQDMNPLLKAAIANYAARNAAAQQQAAMAAGVASPGIRGATPTPGTAAPGMQSQGVISGIPGFQAGGAPIRPGQAGGISDYIRPAAPPPYQTDFSGRGSKNQYEAAQITSRVFGGLLAYKQHVYDKQVEDARKYGRKQAQAQLDAGQSQQSVAAGGGPTAGAGSQVQGISGQLPALAQRAQGLGGPQPLGAVGAQQVQTGATAGQPQATTTAARQQLEPPTPMTAQEQETYNTLLKDPNPKTQKLASQYLKSVQSENKNGARILAKAQINPFGPEARGINMGIADVQAQQTQRAEMEYKQQQVAAEFAKASAEQARAQAEQARYEQVSKGGMTPYQQAQVDYHGKQLQAYTDRATQYNQQRTDYLNEKKRESDRDYNLKLDQLKASNQRVSAYTSQYDSINREQTTLQNANKALDATIAKRQEDLQKAIGFAGIGYHTHAQLVSQIGENVRQLQMKKLQNDQRLIELQHNMDTLRQQMQDAANAASIARGAMGTVGAPSLEPPAAPEPVPGGPPAETGTGTEDDPIKIP